MKTVKFDKETAIVILICAALIAVWHFYYPGAKTPRQTQQSAPAAVAQTESPTAAAPAVQTAVQTVKKIEEKLAKRVASVRNSCAVFYFNSRGALDEITVNDVKRTGTEEPVEFRELSGIEPFSCDLPGWEFRSASVSSSESEVVVVQEYGKDKASVRITKRFSAAKDVPVLNCTMSFSGNSGVIDRVIVWGGSIAPLKQFSGDELRDVHQAEYMLSANGDVITADPSAKKQEKFLGKRTDQPVRWVAVSNKYFLTQLYTVSHPFNGGCDLVNRQEAGYPEPGIAGIYRNVPVPAEYQFSLYSGTKEISLISKLPKDAAGAIHLAYWGWLEPLCRPMLSLLNVLKGVTGSYGWAIILLTVIVKLVLWPLIHRGNKSMRRMQKIQPKLKELKEKYKNDPQLFNQKTMELYREEKVNPMGGCFPMLLQFPVFVALYSTLESAVELRHVSFLWAADLSRPDTVGPLIMGFGIHPLILISTGLMVLQMKLSPQTGDPAQRKMMMFMPLFMLIFFYNFPSGLALYWTVNNILSILQMKFSQYAARKEEERELPPGKNGSAKAV